MERDVLDLKRRMMKIESMVIDIYDATVKDEKMCPVCGSKIRLYLPFGEPLQYNCQCPICRSLARHRSLWLYFQNETDIFKPEREYRILHFAPERVFYDKFSRMANVDYYPVDIDPEYPDIRTTADITDLIFEDSSFDIIIATHVLEHISDEKKALSELHRVLKKDGEAFLNVPIRTGMKKTLENPEFNTPELRQKYYGQSDHVRLYGEDYLQRLESAGFKAEVIEYNQRYLEADLKKYGLWQDEQIYRCVK